MKLPFTVEQFFGVFQAYSSAVRPLQILLLLLAALGSVVAAWVLHTAIVSWPSIVPALPNETSYQAYALVVAMLVLTTLGWLARHRAVGANTRRT